jgi:hypothetical protein
VNDPVVEPLPPGACLLHIGPYKTGSSAVQAALAAARPDLPQHGAAYPGTGLRAMRPGWAVIGDTPRGRVPARPEEWARFAGQVQAMPDARVCVSTEDFGRVERDVAHRVVTDLGRERVHVVTVVRRLDRLLPSQWQQRVQSFHTHTWDGYLRSVLWPREAHAGVAAEAFWQSHDLGRLLDRWSSEVGRDRVIAVVADESDREWLLRVFEGLLCLPTGTLVASAGSNASLPYDVAELVRRLNVLAGERGWPDRVLGRVVVQLAKRVRTAGRTVHEQQVPVPDWAAGRVLELSQERVAALRASGVRVIGDPESLAVTGGAEQPAPPQAEVLGMEVACQVLAGAVEGFLKQREIDRSSRKGRRATPVRSVEDVSTRQLLGTVARRTAAPVRWRRGGAA